MNNRFARGAGLGLALSLVYAFAFFLYAALRISLEGIGAGAPDGTWVQLMTALATACLAFTVAFAPVSALLGGTAYALAQWGRQRNGAWAGVAAPAAVVVALSALAYGLLGPFWPAFYPTGYWFWIGLPGMVLVAAIYWAGTNTRRRRAHGL